MCLKSALRAPQECPKNAPRGSQSTSRAAKGDLGTFLVMILDMSFVIMFNTMLGYILRMRCRSLLKIMLEDPVQHEVEDDLED